MFLFPIILAALFNACMDVLENEHYRRSVFKNLNEHFWYKRESWKHKKTILGYRFDGWHICKSLMILSLAFAIVQYKPWFGLLQDVVLIGVTWNIAFNIFYSILRK